MDNQTATITAPEFAKLNDARRLQIERYRTGYFKKFGKMPKDDPLTDRERLNISFGGDSFMIPIALLTKWTATFGDILELPLSFQPGILTLKYKDSTLKVFTYKGASLDAPIPLNIVEGKATVGIPDIKEELSILVKETTGNRKAIAKAKAIVKAKREENQALNELTKEIEAAEAAQAVVISMTKKDAVKFARRCLAARRLFRNTIANPEAVITWLPATYRVEDRQIWSNDKQDYETAPAFDANTSDVWKEYASNVTKARQACEEYKPRISWPSYFTAKDKKEKPEYGVKKYGPAYDKLKETEKGAISCLEYFVRARFKDYLAAQGLPDCLASEFFDGQNSSFRAYSRARILLSTWQQRKEDLQSRYQVAKTARERAEGKAE